MTEREKLFQEQCELVAQLNSPTSEIGDWKIAKYNEYILAGLEPPYDIKELNEKREANRIRIREISKLLENLDTEN